MTKLLYSWRSQGSEIGGISMGDSVKPIKQMQSSGQENKGIRGILGTLVYLVCTEEFTITGVYVH